MRIGIDAQSTIGSKTGIGYYAANLIEKLAKNPEINLHAYKDSKALDLSTLARVKWENLRMPGLAKRDSLGILHIPGFAGPIKKGNYKKITTVHDLIGMIYPENLGIMSRLYWQRWLPMCVKNSDFIIADSVNTRNDIIRLLNIPEERIEVVYLAVDSIYKPLTNAGQDVLNSYGIRGDYILNVGTVEPRKNIPALIEAFSRCLKELSRDDLFLVIVGKKAWGYEDCVKMTQKYSIKEKIVFCDYARQVDMPLLYNGAEAFVYPSLYEGFGLPVLEAMSCGIPVVCSDVSSVPEIAGEAGYYFDPNHKDSMLKALVTALNDPGLRESLSKKSLERARIFSWDKTVKE
ncbi:MAG: glycosyltransferase family 1 protein, partial [Candidatus Omnitrophota bacterium]